MLKTIKKQAAIGTQPFRGIVQWLTGDECHELDEAGMAARLGQRLRSAGLSLIA